MKITISSIALLLLFVFAAKAQSSYSIKGLAIDTTEKKALQNATILVLNAKDSILNKYAHAAAGGSFAIDNLGKGKFILLVTYPGYADYVEGFTLDEKGQLSHDFGKLGMILKARLLQDVIIKGEVTAIKMKGDTTEFNAKAYVIQPNSKVEDLLKQLPGIQVDKDGKITAQGEKVTKVLVDGEEFFGDDPTLVTKNIRGDMVDKVQLFDKKSDQATFTGIDDGVKTKTLNIKLKADKKNGYFGKVDAGVGNDGYYQGQALFNKFKAKEKLSGYIAGSNTNKSGLSWEDSQKYTDGGFDGGGDVITYNGQGIPVSRLGGAHYDNKWNNDKQIVNANYKIGSLSVIGSTNNLTQNNLPGLILNTDADQTFNKYVFRQKLDAAYTVQLDSTSNIKITGDGAYRHTTNTTDYFTVKNRGFDTLLNRESRTTMNNAQQHIMNASIFYTKKLKKKGRTLSVLMSQLIDHTNGKFNLKSDVDYFNPITGAIDSSVLINQFKTNDAKHTQFNSNITYTEPLSKYVSVIVNYGINLDDNSSDKRTYNQSAPGIYNVFVADLSNYFKLNQVSNQFGAALNYTRNKTVLNFGTRASDVAFKQIDEYTGNIYKRNFINWNPQAMYMYKVSQQEAFRFNYNGNSTQPSITQIQPVKVNTDPTNLVIGNPNLRPSFGSNFNIFYNSYKVLSAQSIYISASYNNTLNPIVNNVTTDNAGKSIIHAANITDRTPHGFGIYGGINRKIKGPEIQLGFNGNLFSNISYNLANSLLNTTNSTNYSGSLTIGKYEVKKYDFYISFGPNYSVLESSSSLQKINNNSAGYTANGYFNFYFPGKIQLKSDISTNYKGKTTYNPSNSQTIWNATLSKAFLKESNLKFSLSGNDLLNQNNGYNRSAYGGTISQNTYTTIKRFFMFSVTWDFNKMGGGVAAPAPTKN